MIGGCLCSIEARGNGVDGRAGVSYCRTRNWFKDELFVKKTYSIHRPGKPLPLTCFVTISDRPKQITLRIEGRSTSPTYRNSFDSEDQLNRHLRELFPEDDGSRIMETP